MENFKLELAECLRRGGDINPQETQQIKELSIQSVQCVAKLAEIVNAWQVGNNEIQNKLTADGNYMWQKQQQMYERGNKRAMLASDSKAVSALQIFNADRHNFKSGTTSS